MPLGKIDFVDYLVSDPIKSMSGASRAYIRVYRKYLKICREEVINSNSGITDEDIIFKKRELSVKMYKLKKTIPTTRRRELMRIKDKYMEYKRVLFCKKINSTKPLS